MGAIPNKFPGGQDVEDPELPREVRARLRPAAFRRKRGWHLSQMFEAMEHGELRALYVIGENPVQSEADCAAARRAARGSGSPGRAGHLPDEDRGARATWCFRPRASWCESEGTVTSSERRVQRVRKALDPPGEARDDIDILCDAGAAARARTGARRRRNRCGTKCAACRPWHARHELRAARGAGRHCSGPARTRTIPAARFCTGASGRIRSRARARRSSRSQFAPPVDELTESSRSG